MKCSEEMDIEDRGNEFQKSEVNFTGIAEGFNISVAYKDEKEAYEAFYILYFAYQYKTKRWTLETSVILEARRSALEDDFEEEEEKGRWTLEASGVLEARRSALEDDFEEEEEKEDEAQAMDVDVNTHEKGYYRGRSPTRDRDRDRKRDNYKYRWVSAGFVVPKNSTQMGCVACVRGFCVCHKHAIEQQMQFA
ncbi:hypothetical protein M5K25_000493 [Dendrobium thyrsiflorum]|uniref:Uncharacterized protein n=1 Tax=Dendrobium thyrsiflorum TaxID=117978 RepID=A0ABD0VTS0_DENTH